IHEHKPKKIYIVRMKMESEQFQPDGNVLVFFFSSRRRHTRSDRDWSSDVCSSDLRRAPFSSGYLANRPSWSQVSTPDCCRLHNRSEERRVGKECRSRWVRSD